MMTEKKKEYVDPFVGCIPPKGMVYEWKACNLNGDKDDHLAKLFASGWMPVKALRHRKGLPKGYKLSDPIVKCGMMLCERSIDLTIASKYNLCTDTHHTAFYTLFPF